MTPKQIIARIKASRKSHLVYLLLAVPEMIAEDLEAS